MEKQTEMYKSHYNDTVPFWMPLNSNVSLSTYIILEISKSSSILSASLYAACLPAIIPGCASAAAPVFHTEKVIASYL